MLRSHHYNTIPHHHLSTAMLNNEHEMFVQKRLCLGFTIVPGAVAKQLQFGLVCLEDMVSEVLRFNQI